MDEPTLDKFPKRVLASIGVETAFIVSRLMIAAERLQLFRLLGTKQMKADTSAVPCSTYAAVPA